MKKTKITDEEIQEKLDTFHSLTEALEWLRFIEQGGVPGDWGLGSVTTFEGDRGAGTTLTAVAFAYKEHLATGKPVYSNMNLNFPYRALKRINFNTITSSIILLDDTYILMDSRNTMSKTNKLWSYLFIQNKKRGLKIFLVAPYITFLDVRIRQCVDIRVTCLNLGNGHFQGRLLDLRTIARRLVPIDGKQYFGLYDPKQIQRISR